MGLFDDLLGGGGAGVQADPRLAQKRDELQKEGASLDKILRERLEQDKAQEATLRGQLGERRAQLEQFVDERLARNLEGISQQAGEVRADVGEAAAERGLLRSSFTGEKLQDVTLREEQARGQERARAGEEKEAVIRAEQDVVKGIDQRREEIDRAFQQKERDQILQLEQALSQAVVQQTFEAQFANMQLDSSRKQALFAIGGNLAKQAGSILGGGMGGGGGGA